MKVTQLQFPLYGTLDVDTVWKKFLPYAEKCWRLQRESWTAGNCHDWWGSRFQSFFLGHGRPVEQRDYNSASMFPAVWEKYGQVMQGGGRW